MGVRRHRRASAAASLASSRSAARAAAGAHRTTRETGVNECISALYLHLKNVQIKYDNTAEWEDAARWVMRDSVLAKTLVPVQGHVKFLYSITEGESRVACRLGPPIQGSKATGVLKAEEVSWEKPNPYVLCGDQPDGDELDPSDPDHPSNHGWYHFEITRDALYQLFIGSSFRDVNARATMTANKFSQDVGAIFSAAAAPFCYEEDAFVVASDKTGAMLRTDNGVRAWRFKTQQLRTYLEGAYPELKAGRKGSEVHDDGLALSKMIMNKTTSGGSMFAPV